jgi:WD40 repeat protein
MTPDFLCDQFATQNIWHSRRYEDVKLMCFESAALGAGNAAIISTPFSRGRKVLSVFRCCEPSSQWSRFPIHVNSPISSMCLDSQNAWVLSKSSVFRVSLLSEARVTSRLPIAGSGSLTLFRDGAMAAFPIAHCLFFVRPAGEVRPIPIRYSGVTCLSALNDRVVCGVAGSGALRLVDPDGREERAFVGHCGQATAAEPMSHFLFASRGEDQTVRIWDLRQRTPLSTILLANVSVASLAGSGSYLVCGFQNRSIGVVELRKDRGKALLGVQTQDYVPIAMRFDSQADLLAVFGLADKEMIGSGVMFTDGDGQSHQQIFRKYSDFLGTAAGGKVG